MKLIIPSLNDIEQVARQFLSEIGNTSLIALHGEMGAGKTTFVAAVCSVLGVQDTVNSPTFAIVNEYCRPDGSNIFHFDFYRIRHFSEAIDLGFEDYFYGKSLCFIEWPEKIQEILPPHVLHLSIREQADGFRILEW